MKEDSDTENPKKEYEKPEKSRASKFMQKLDFAQISEHEQDKEARNSKDSKSGDKDEHDSHEFSLLSDLLGPEMVKKIKSAKSQILMATGIFIGILFVIFGIIMIMGSVDRVADNVVFGEREVFSVFLILVGLIIIACSVAYKFLGESFFKEIDDDMNSTKKSSDSAKNNIKKDNINRDNR